MLKLPPNMPGPIVQAQATGTTTAAAVSNQQSWQTLRSALEHGPGMTGVIDGPIPVRIDHYTVQFPGIRTTVFPTPLLIAHLDGAPVTLRASGSDSVRNTRGCFFLPHPGQRYEWQCTGALEFAAVHFLNPDVLPVKHLLRSAARDPRTINLVRHPLTAALLRQIVSVIQGGDSPNDAFVQRMLAFLIDDCTHVMEQPPRSTPSNAQLNLSQLQGWLRTHLNKPIGAEDMALFLNISESQLRQKLRQQLNLTVSQFLRKFRLQHARSLLADTQLTLGHIASECGYDSQSHFTTSFSQAMGISPGRYRRALQDIQQKQRQSEKSQSIKESD